MRLSVRNVLVVLVAIFSVTGILLLHISHNHTAVDHASPIQKKVLTEFSQLKDSVSDHQPPTPAPPSSLKTVLEPVVEDTRHVPFVFIKTFSDASEATVNVLHRSSERKGSRLVLPRDGEHLGWPYSRDLPFDYYRKSTEAGTFDGFCSGYARRQSSSQTQLVPAARFLVTLEDPVHQLQSVYQSIGSNMTADQFLRSVFEMTPFSLKERKMVRNSQTYSLGYPTSLKAEQFEKVLQALDARLDCVLIADYMDESLVLLAETLNLRLSDVVAHHARVEPQTTFLRQASRIRDHSLADWVLYQHYNITLWDRISGLDDFQAKLTEFRRLKAAVKAQCKPYWAEIPDHGNLLERAKASSTRNQTTLDANLCYRFLLSSEDYVSLFKHQQGYVEQQCKPKTRTVLLKTHKTGSSTLTNMFHRFATKHKLAVALPKDNLYLGWPYEKGMLNSYVRRGDQPMDVFCSGHARYKREYLEKIVPDATYFTVLRNPVDHFLSSWAYWHVSDHFRDNKKIYVTMEQFLETPDKYLKIASASDHRLLKNNQAYDLGFDENVSEEEVRRRIEGFDTEFGLILLTEYMDESLVLLRRIMCWELDDVS